MPSIAWPCKTTGSHLPATGYISFYQYFKGFQIGVVTVPEHFNIRDRQYERSFLDQKILKQMCGE